LENKVEETLATVKLIDYNDADVIGGQRLALPLTDLARQLQEEEDRGLSGLVLSDISLTKEDIIFKFITKKESKNATHEL
jgi:hypothetical protein